MSDYEREWTTARDFPPGQRLHFGLTTERGAPVRLLCQLEYWHGGMWLPVARFDHDATGPAYRDIERAGLHMDIYAPDGTQTQKKTDFQPVSVNQALDYAERYLRTHRERLTRRFKRDL